jgi:hypothetical protein
MPNTSPQNNIDLEEIATRNSAAHHVVAGFSATMPTLAEIWRCLEDSLNDVPALLAEVARLSGEQRNARLERANLIAAARATIAAQHDGEADPLYYLRDELDASTAVSQATWGRA